jgi:hypothetical protein
LIWSSVPNAWLFEQVFELQHSSSQAADPVPQVQAAFRHVFWARQLNVQPCEHVVVEFMQVFCMLQSITQAVALPQRIRPSHVFCESQLMRHFMPAGHAGLIELLVT